jgi:hypothetical protein
LLQLASGGVRVARRLDELQQRLDREWKPTLESVGRIGRNLAEVSDLLALQARRVDELVQDTAARVEDVRAQLERAVMRPLLAPLEELSRLGRALRRGLEVYRQLGGLSAQGRGKGRGYGSDDHLFI